MPPPMSTPGSRATAIGLAIMLLSVSGGVHFSTCGFGLLLSFTGVLAGTNLVAFGVSMADNHPAPPLPAAFGGARALAVFMRRSAAAVGLVMACCAITAVSGGEADPVLFFAMFALLLGGLTLLNAGDMSTPGKLRLRCRAAADMSTPGSRATSIGLAITLLSVSGGIHFSSTCGPGLLLSFTGVLAGANLVAFGVSMADDHPAPRLPAAFGSARALAAFMRRSAAAVGLVMACCAVTAVSGEADPVLFFAMFALLLLGLTLINAGDMSIPGKLRLRCRAAADMSTPGSRATAIGLAITLLSVSGGIHFSSTCGVALLSFMGVLAGASLVAFGVSKADDNPAPTFPAAFGGARALVASMRRSTAAVGLVMASCAVTAVSGEADPVLLFAMFAVLLGGLTLINAGVRGD